MIEPADLCAALEAHGITFFSGVPDSLLAPLCAYVDDHVPRDQHVINANEGSAVALAAGYHLATGRTPAVYLQNSGTGNTVNPLLSLVDPDVYRIPILFIVGWRGEPAVPDEPQHVAQGRLMPALLEALGLSYDVLDAGTKNVAEVVDRASERMAASGRSHVLLVRKGTFASYESQRRAGPEIPLSREQAIEAVLEALAPEDLVVSTTGMTSREVFEHRERRGEGHERDFLTVGSMGHCSQIALGLALHQPTRQVFCLDGDGAVIMHMGSLAVIGQQGPSNLKHVVLNNGAHDSVGGQPTAGFDIDLCAIARACGYENAERAGTLDEVRAAVRRARASDGPVLLEIRVRKGARADLGRPTTTPIQNKLAFMRALGHEPR